MMKVAIVIFIIGTALYGLHRLALWMEGRGWIYYKNSGSSTARSSAFLSVQSILEPNKQYVVEERIRKQDAVYDSESGAPPADDDKEFDGSDSAT